MANGFQGPPAVDFYSMLSGLGDTIAKNREQSAIAGAFQPGADGKVDYHNALATVAQYNPALAVSMQNHLDSQAHQTIEDKRNAANDARAASNDTFSHGIQSANLKIAQANLANNSEGPEEVAQQRANAATTYGLKPGTPEYQSYVLNGSLPDPQAAGKPIPYETLSGTKFLVRQPDGSYAQVDPTAIGRQQPQPQPQPGQPNPQVPPAVNPAATGSPQPQPVVQPQPSPQPMVQPQPATAPPVAVQPGPASAPQTAQPQPAQSPADLDAVDPKTGRRENWLKAQAPDVQDYIKKVADYEADPRTSSTKGGHREQIMSAVAKYDPTYDVKEFGSRAKAVKDFGTGQQGNSIRSFDVAIDHLDTLKRYTKALDSGDIRALNSLRNAWLQETGNPLPTNVQAIAPIVGAEVSKAIIGSNNALADREELRKPLALANSPAQVLGAIDSYQALMGGQLKGLKKQYEDTTGRKNFDSRIRENTRNVLLGGGGDGSASTSQSQPNVTSSGVKWSIQ